MNRKEPVKFQRIYFLRDQNLIDMKMPLDFSTITLESRNNGAMPRKYLKENFLQSRFYVQQTIN